jgi:hypothetical protein
MKILIICVNVTNSSAAVIESINGRKEEEESLFCVQ